MEDTAARHNELLAVGVMAMWGVGFDVVPSDCLAAHMKRRLPNATRLELYIHAGENLSCGTLSSFVEAMGLPNVVRAKHQLVSRPAG